MGLMNSQIVCVTACQHYEGSAIMKKHERAMSHLMYDLKPPSIQSRYMFSSQKKKADVLFLYHLYF